VGVGVGWGYSLISKFVYGTNNVDLPKCLLEEGQSKFFFLNQVCCYWVIELAWMCESGNEDIQHILPFSLIKVTFSNFCLLFLL
jgi:hypothetical protein